jgi:hypothetical protein
MKTQGEIEAAFFSRDDEKIGRNPESVAGEWTEAKP